MPFPSSVRGLFQRPTTQNWQGLIHAYNRWLPVSDRTPVISLCEGSTPLVAAPALSARLGRGIQVHLKVDGLNPTGSFKIMLMCRENLMLIFERLIAIRSFRIDDHYSGLLEFYQRVQLTQEHLLL